MSMFKRNEEAIKNTIIKDEIFKCYHSAVLRFLTRTTANTEMLSIVKRLLGERRYNLFTKHHRSMYVINRIKQDFFVKNAVALGENAKYCQILKYNSNIVLDILNQEEIYDKQIKKINQTISRLEDATKKLTKVDEGPNHALVKLVKDTLEKSNWINLPQRESKILAMFSCLNVTKSQNIRIKDIKEEIRTLKNLAKIL